MFLFLILGVADNDLVSLPPDRMLDDNVSAGFPLDIDEILTIIHKKPRRIPGTAALDPLFETRTDFGAGR